MTVHALVPQCALSVMSFSKWKIAKISQGCAHGPHWRGLTVPSPSRLNSCIMVSLLAMLIEKPAPKKVAGYSTAFVVTDRL